MQVQVETFADHRGVETPRRLDLNWRTVEIVESDDQWSGADYRYFRVKGDDGNVYILRLNEPSGEWELTMFQRQAETLATQVTREKRAAGPVACEGAHLILDGGSASSLYAPSAQQPRQPVVAWSDAGCL
jgi:hypothetical protein